nr:protein FAR-RED IMPAIRED RESPONSE 1 isoform X1 [Ipomoea batatas]
MGIDLERPSEELHRDKGNEVCCTEEAASSAAMTVQHDQENFRPKNTHLVSDGDRVPLSHHKFLEPHDGMEFESKEDAFSFYKEYANSIGFSVIIKASRRSRISGKFIDAKFVCTRYGSKQKSSVSETPEAVANIDGTNNIPIKKKRGRKNQSLSKTDCKACLHVKRGSDGMWVIHTFIKEHNHEIVPVQSYNVQGHRNLDQGHNNADAMHAVRDRTKKMCASMHRQSGVAKKLENNGSTNVGAQNLALDEQDAEVMLEYFLHMQDDNPNFFYALDLNQDQCLRNAFWIDAKPRLDYHHFCDAVFFDTAYIKNEYKLPLVTFIGVNHHFQFLLFGCALIADESKSTFVWLMRAWLRAMGGQAPKVILTDEDTALKEAVTEVFPDSRHCFCLWHVLSKIPEKLGSVIRRCEKFSTKFNKCILKSVTDEQFQKRWLKIVDRFDLRNDLWIQSLYEDHLRWVPVYMNSIFLAGISTMQRSESVCSILDKCMQRKTTLKEFLDQYKNILQEMGEDEAKADFETWHRKPGLKSPSPFGKQMAALYTHAIFKKFQIEVLGVVACHPKRESGNGEAATFRVQDFEENQDFTVFWNEKTSDTSCSCRLFEYKGILCRHIMIVLQMAGVYNIPSKYILKRWTKDAKSRETVRLVDSIESRVQRYTDICQRVFKLGDEGSLSQESFNLAFIALEKALRKCERVNSSIQYEVELCSPSNQDLNNFEEATQSNCAQKTNEKDESRRDKVQMEQEGLAISIHDSWQQMGQLNSRVATLDAYFSNHQVVPGVGQMNTISSIYSNQPGIQELGQLNTTAPMDNGPYLTQPRLHGLTQLHFRPQSLQNYFEMPESLQDLHEYNGDALPDIR